MRRRERGTQGEEGARGVRGERARRWPNNFDRTAKEKSAFLLDAMPTVLEVASRNIFHNCGGEGARSNDIQNYTKHLSGGFGLVRL